MPAIKMQDKEYYGLDRVSFSSLKYILDSVKKYIHNKEQPFTGNQYTVLGNAIHCWLQNDKHRVSFLPDLSHIKTKAGVVAKAPEMTDEGKAIIAEFKKTIPHDNFLVPKDTIHTLNTIEKHFLENPHINSLMEKVTDIEQAYLSSFQGIPVKGKLDFEGQYLILDIKSTSKAINNPYIAKNIITSSYYDMQQVMYGMMKAEAQKCHFMDFDYYIVFTETEAPYEVKLVRLSTETLQQGYDKFNRALELYNKHIINKEPTHSEVMEV